MVLVVVLLLLLRNGLVLTNAVQPIATLQNSLPSTRCELHAFNRAGLHSLEEKSTNTPKRRSNTLHWIVSPNTLHCIVSPLSYPGKADNWITFSFFSYGGNGFPTNLILDLHPCSVQLDGCQAKAG